MIKKSSRGVCGFLLPRRKYWFRLAALSGENWARSRVRLRFRAVSWLNSDLCCLSLCMCFMNVLGEQLLNRMIPDKWGSKCWPFNELQASEHLFRGLILSHRALYMAGTQPQWVTDPWPIATFTWLIHTRPHHDFSLCRWTFRTISQGKSAGKGQLPFCMVIKRDCVSVFSAVSHSKWISGHHLKHLAEK